MQAHTSRALALAAVVSLIAAIYVSRALPDPEPESGGRVQLIIGPKRLGAGVLQLERHSLGGHLPLLRITANSKRGFDDSDLAESLDLCTRVLARRQPFVILWDVRSVAWPRISPSQFTTVHKWIETHLVPWDTHVQAPPIPHSHHANPPILCSHQTCHSTHSPFSSGTHHLALQSSDAGPPPACANRHSTHTQHACSSLPTTQESPSLANRSSPRARSPSRHV